MDSQFGVMNWMTSIWFNLFVHSKSMLVHLITAYKLYRNPSNIQIVNQRETTKHYQNVLI